MSQSAPPASGPSAANAPGRKPDAAFVVQRRVLGPVPDGHIRGRIGSVVAESSHTRFGLTTTWTITVKPASKEPAFVVVMRGLTLSKQCRQGMWLEVEWNDPPERTVYTNQAFLPHLGEWLTVFNPTLPDARRRLRGRLLTILTIVAPVALIGGVALLLSFYNFFR